MWLYFGYTSRYVLKIDTKKLIKEQLFFSFKKPSVIADFSDIKLIAVSTVVNLNYNKHKSNTVSYSYETIAAYGKDNKTIVLEINNQLGLDSELIIFNNIRAFFASKIVNCLFIPCDKSSKITINQGQPYDNIESLIIKTPKEKQLPGLDFKKTPVE
jgi:hypothetical protein